MRKISYLLILLSMGLAVSCMIREGELPPDDGRPLFLEFRNPVQLGLNLSSLKSDPNHSNIDFSEDMWELFSAHSINSSTLSIDSGSGIIDNLRNILQYAHEYEDRRKPSIVLTLNCATYDSTKVFTKEEVGPAQLYNIPNLRTYCSHDLLINTITTEKNHIQVVWDVHGAGIKNAEYNLEVSGHSMIVNWDNESVVNWVKCYGGIATRSGGSSGGSSGGASGGSSGRPSSGTIIPNTLGMDEHGNYYDYPVDPDDEDHEVVEEEVIEEEEAEEAEEAEEEFLLEDYCEVENPMVSPTLLRHVYSGGRFQDNLHWRIPTFYTRVN